MSTTFLSFRCKAFVPLSHSNESAQYSTLQNKNQQKVSVFACEQLHGTQHCNRTRRCDIVHHAPGLTEIKSECTGESGLRHISDDSLTKPWGGGENQVTWWSAGVLTLS